MNGDRITATHGENLLNSTLRMISATDEFLSAVDGAAKGTTSNEVATESLNRLVRERNDAHDVAMEADASRDA